MWRFFNLFFSFDGTLRSTPREKTNSAKLVEVLSSKGPEGTEQLQFGK